MQTPEVAPSSADIRQFYDRFLESRMMSYRLNGNVRIDRAVERIMPYIRPESRVLDLGCGIGLVVERLARKATRGSVWGCDISDRNIWYARKTVPAPNARFIVGNILTDAEDIRRWVAQPIDVVTLVDVLEHLPVPSHEAVFGALATLTGPSGVVVITCPSPQYQRYLRTSDPGELQPVDEVIELDHLVRVASSGGFSLRHFSLEDMWMKNQYMHVVLQRDAEIGEPAPTEMSVIARLRQKVGAVVDRQLLLPARRRRYVTSILGPHVRR